MADTLTGLKTTTLQQDKTNKQLYKNTSAIEPGYYLILASGSADYIYNPMLVGASQTPNGVKQMYLDGDMALNTKPAVPKQSVPTITKKSDEKDSAVSMNEGDTVKVGQNIRYTITTTIPTYNQTIYQNPQFNIVDQLSTGLTLNQASIEVAVGSNNVEQKPENYTLVDVSDQAFKIQFTKEFIMSHRGQEVKVTYTAQLNENAVTNVNQNTNMATLEYSNNPKDESQLTKKSDKTYHYTFELDGNLFGNKKNLTHELIKTSDETWSEEVTETFTDNKPIAEAVFKLISPNGNEYYATSDENGLLNFKGLKAAQYDLQEVTPPTGYALLNKQIGVKIETVYNDGSEEDTGYKGTLREYSVTVKYDESTKINTYKIYYKDSEKDSEGNIYRDTVEKIIVNDGTQEITFDHGTVVEEVDLGQSSDHATEIKNTKLESLPSTGKMGTYLFTIIGVAVITMAGSLYIKKKNRQTINTQIN